MRADGTGDAAVLWWKTMRLGDENDTALRETLQRVLSGTGAVLLRHSRRTAGARDTETWRYRVGARLLRVRSDVDEGLTIHGPSRLVARIGDEVREQQPASIQIHGWVESPGRAELRTLAGEVVAVIVDVPFRGEPIPLGEFFRFARVLSVTELLRLERCVRCGDDSIARVHLAWEAGYHSPDGDVACEHCLNGRVTSGAEFADVPEAPSDRIRLEIPLAE